MSALVIQGVEPGSAVERLGVLPGDRLLAIDGLVPRDVIDLHLELPDARCLTVERGDGQRLELSPDGPLDPAGLILADPMPGGIRECNNHCEFCFIRGLPKGLRPTLYIFDDDYRYSFMWGNFLTLTNLDETDWARIGYQRLSPLHVSVHATDDEVRRRLLSNRHAPPILACLERLGRVGVEVHAQVVLCAGINDGAVLDTTITDLAGLFPAVRSLSIVPVGLTRYSRVRRIRRPSVDEALAAVEQCERWQASLRGRLGVGFVYPSDELLRLAGRERMPPAAQYDGFPALANGVGLLRNMLDTWERLLGRRTLSGRPRRMLWLTGRLAAPALEAMAEAWRARAGWQPEVKVVDNTFFGNDVTVSGLLAGVDLLRGVGEVAADVEDIVLPRGPFGFDGRCTLDGVSLEAIGAAHPGRVHVAADPGELLAILTG